MLFPRQRLPFRRISTLDEQVVRQGENHASNGSVLLRNIPCFYRDAKCAGTGASTAAADDVPATIGRSGCAGRAISGSAVRQVLAASTYPLELAEAGQWLQQNQGLTGKALMDAARQQNWDPSVAALVAFPDVLNRLTSDIRWTTIAETLLAQQADVMAAVQRLRARAQANGRLQSGPQENVVTQNQGGQTAIQIEPADPNVIYVPSYNPAYVWGPPVYGAYPPLWYPGLDVGFTFWPGIEIGGFFGGWGGWGWGWGGWGWAPNWFGGGLFVNDRSIHRFGYRDFHGAGGYGMRAWAHNPEHRLGVAYPNRDLAGRFGGGVRGGERFGGKASPGAAISPTGKVPLIGKAFAPTHRKPEAARSGSAVLASNNIISEATIAPSGVFTAEAQRAWKAITARLAWVTLAAVAATSVAAGGGKR